jgi:hypothetical protein
MPNNQVPLGDTDFWWLRYFCGLALPVVLAIYGDYSILSLHSYAVWINAGISGKPLIALIPVEGKQAILMGVAYLGIALALFANCYAQYHEKMGFYYQWILAPGVIVAGVGLFWCSWISLSH